MITNLPGQAGRQQCASESAKFDQLVQQLTVAANAIGGTVVPAAGPQTGYRTKFTINFPDGEVVVVNLDLLYVAGGGQPPVIRTVLPASGILP